MRHLTFGLILPSEILATGMSGILRKLPETNTIVEIPVNNYLEAIAKSHPSILIVDPSVAGVDWEVLKSASTAPIKIIGLLCHLYPQDRLKWFDDSFSVYDPAETVLEIIKRNLTSDDLDDRGKDLSPREKEVIVGIVKGMSNKEIASEMNVSVNTIMTHRRNIAAKLHIHTPAGLTIYAIVSNLVRLEDIKADIDKL